MSAETEARPVSLQRSYQAWHPSNPSGAFRDNDIDLLVLEASPQQLRRESVRLRNALRGLRYPFDVMVMATEQFEQTKEIIGGLAYPANKYGRVIYEASG